ncbi:MAG: hypothetical protein ACJAVM_000475 [Sulfitobacter sp.]|jgi:hypothetical protein
MLTFRTSTTLKASSLVTVIAAALASLTILLNQRQEMSLYPTIAMVVLAGLSLVALKPHTRVRQYSASRILLALLAVGFISNMNYLSGEVKTPFENWARFSFPILLVPFSTVLILRSRENLRIFTVFFLVVAVFAVYKVHTISDILVSLLSDSLQTNWGNALAAASPFIFFVRNRIVRNALLLVVVLTLVVSLKRTAFLSAAVLVFSLLLANWDGMLKRTRFTVRNAIVALVGLIGSMAAVFMALRDERMNYYFDRAFIRIENARVDGGSGRTAIWADSSRIMEDSGILGNIFGHGFGWFDDNGHRYGFAVESLHSDLVDFWISFGLAGVLIYIALLGRLAYLAVFVSRNHREHMAFAISSVLIFYIYSMFAGVFFFYAFFTPLFVAVGVLEAFRNSAPPRAYKK